jgi:hypothetical protein
VPNDHMLPEAPHSASGNFRKLPERRKMLIASRRPVALRSRRDRRSSTTDYTDIHGWRLAPFLFLSVSIREIRGQTSRPHPSRGLWPRTNRIAAVALAAGGHAGPERIGRSRSPRLARPEPNRILITPPPSAPAIPPTGRPANRPPHAAIQPQTERPKLSDPAHETL